MNFVEETKLKNLILDLGGVLYAIDVERTSKELAALAGPKAMRLSQDAELFHALEMGHISEADFRNELRIALDCNCDDAQLDFAWNALLLGPIEGRLEWLQKLSKHFRLILLSNTNTIHSYVWGPQCAEMFALMEKTWFSFDLGMRKPNPEVYAHVLKAMSLNASESLFLDDSVANIEGAKQVGLPGILIDPNDAHQFEKICLDLLAKV